MVYDQEEGSATIEGAILFPVILMIIFSIFLMIMQSYNMFSVLNGLGHSLRVSGYGWYEDNKLYDDILNDYNSSKITANKLAGARILYGKLLKPVYVSNKGSFSMNNYLLYRNIKGRVGTLEESYPIFRGSVFMRSSKYAKEVLEDAFSYLKENLSDNQEVYVVDDNLDEQEYDRVYHLYSDCSYLKNGYNKRTSIGESRTLGFRVCRICLARKTGMD